MTERQRQNLRANRDRLVGWINEIDRVIHDIAVKGTASATLSAGGGSKSYTHIDLASLRSLRADYADELVQIKRKLGGALPGGIRRIMIVRA